MKTLGWACWPDNSDQQDQHQLCTTEPFAYKNRVPLIAAPTLEVMKSEFLKTYSYETWLDDCPQSSMFRIQTQVSVGIETQDQKLVFQWLIQDIWLKAFDSFTN